MIKYHKISVS